LVAVAQAVVVSAVFGGVLVVEAVKLFLPSQTCLDLEQ
jgi:hypothetical protein